MNINKQLLFEIINNPEYKDADNEKMRIMVIDMLINFLDYYIDFHDIKNYKDLTYLEKRIIPQEIFEKIIKE